MPCRTTPATAVALSRHGTRGRNDLPRSQQKPAGNGQQQPAQKGATRFATAQSTRRPSGTPSRLANIPTRSRISGKDYEADLLSLDVELLKVQKWVKEAGEKIVLIFEGRDAAGKGGTIKRFMEHLNPRGARIVALEKPSEREKTQWYFQRYIQNLPSGGEIVFLRPLLVQSRWRRTRHELLHAQ